MKRITIILILLFLIAAIPLGVAQAQEGDPPNRTIKSGEVINEDVAVYGGNLFIEPGAIVNGDILVFGGHAEVGGTIDGDVAIFGGDVELTGTVVGDFVIFGGNLDVGSQAQVDGDCALLGGNVTGDGASKINCTAVGEDFPFPIGAIMGVPSMPPPPEFTDITHTFFPPRGISGFFRDVGEAVGSSLMLGLLALIVAALLPNQLNQVSDVVVRKPVASGTVGVLTAMAGPFAIAIMAVVSSVLIILCGLGLLGFPVVLLMSIALGFGLLMGWIAVGTLLGQRLAESMKLTNRSLPVVAALGTAILTLLTSVLSALPLLLGGLLGSLMILVIGSAGLGAVALTKFGTQSYPVGLSNEEKIAAVLETLPVEDVETA